ncbi:hypothetical protein BKA64DRAFT_344241 [Cadophora sp. MPI-SDFR-AT-0126]|nr:hypothetical protein BKA64DRAFT_344241 [Leotiomycetes sp. MPI-SDFR-AT-0126]
MRHRSVLSAAVQQCAVAIISLLASLKVGYLLSKFRVPYIVVGTCTVACLVGRQILLATAPVSQSYWAQTFVALIVLPWPTGMAFPVGTIILSDEMPRKHQGVASSLTKSIVVYSNLSAWVLQAIFCGRRTSEEIIFQEARRSNSMCLEWSSHYTYCGFLSVKLGLRISYACQQYHAVD